MKHLRIFLALTAVTVLAGCLHVQIFGSIGGATVTVAPIFDRDNIVFEGQTFSRQAMPVLVGQEVWDAYQPIVQLAFLGILTTDKNTMVEDDKVYLVTATGGVDEDMDTNLSIDDSGTPVSAPIHSIMTGAQIKSLTGKVSVLTEAMYQAMDPTSLDNHDEQWFKDEQNLFAERFVSDVNADGTIDFEDVLQWSRIVGSEQFVGDPVLLQDFSQALIDGASPDTLFDMAQELMASGINTEHELAGAWELVFSAGTTVCSDGSTTPIPAASHEVIVSITNNVMSLPNSDWSALDGWEITGDSGISGGFDNGVFELTQTLTGIPLDNTDLGEREINVSYAGLFSGDTWSGDYLYDFEIAEFDFSCESEQTFSGSRLQ